MSTLLIHGGRVIDPSQELDAIVDVLIEDGKIKYVGKMKISADEEWDASGMIVSPGLIDMHVHLREPGKEEEETIASGSAAAVAAGFSSVACMPNTEPAVDNEASAAFVLLQAAKAGKANVYPIGAITKGREGNELAEIGQLSRAGAVAFSDDGDSVHNARVMRSALLYTKMFDSPIVAHCEDRDLSGNGVMNSGYVSTTLGLPGVPNAAEDIMVNRDIILAAITGGKLHIAHVSTAGSVELIRQAKQKGVKVTAETAPHYFALTDECVKTFDPNFKMNPPLRTGEDREVILQGLADGTIDAIASDHAPHAPEEKDVEFSLAPFGVIGMESLLPVAITELVEKGVLTWQQLIAKLTSNPARILGIAKGTLQEGADADVTIIDPKVDWTIDATRFYSKSRNCPFHGRKVKGRAVAVIVNGEVKSPDDDTH